MNMCPSCGNCFSSKRALQKHISNVHEGQKNFKCDKCGKGFGDQGYLKRHIAAVHEGSRNYNCEICGKTYAHQEQIHFVCTLRTKRFFHVY